MFNLLKLFNQLRARKKDRKLFNKPARSALKFKKAYPDFTISSHCYGLPLIKHQHQDAILKVRSYCSFAKNVQIFLGGNHRIDWVTTYRFPVFFQQAKHMRQRHSAKARQHRWRSRCRRSTHCGRNRCYLHDSRLHHAGLGEIFRGRCDHLQRTRRRRRLDLEEGLRH